MKFVRRKISAQALNPPNTRYDVDTDTVQTTPDNGATWNDNEGADPRKNPAYQLPPNEAVDKRCAAAAGMAEYFRLTVEKVGAFQAPLGIANGLLALIILFFPVGLFVSLLLAIGVLAVDIGFATLNSLFDEEGIEKLKCVFYDRLNADGQMTQADFEGLSAAIDDALESDIAGAWADAVLKPLGVVGLNNAGVQYADEEADCGACAGWGRLWDFEIDEQGWEAQTGGQAVYTAGVGWQTVGLDSIASYYRYTAIAAPIACDVDFIRMVFELTQGDCYDTGDVNQIASQGFANIFWQNEICSDPASPATWCYLDLPFPAPVTITQLLVQMFAGASAAHVDPGGQCTIKSIAMFGRGEPPEGGAEIPYEECI